MSIFVERFLLSFLAAVTVLVAVTNPMHWDWKARVGGSLALMLLALLASKALRNHQQRQAMQPAQMSISDSHVTGTAVAVGSNITQILQVDQLAQPALPIRQRRPIGPTPHEVFDALRDLPPYQTVDAIQHYHNLEVGLPLEFINVGRHDLGWMAMFAFHVSGRAQEHVFSFLSNADIERFPRFKTLARGSWLWMEGKIDNRIKHAFAVVPNRIEFE